MLAFRHRVNMDARYTQWSNSVGIRKGVAVVLALHASWLVWTGYVKALGVILPVLQDDFSSQTWLVGWIIAAMNGVGDFVGPLAGPLENILGTGVVVMTSGFLIGMSLIGAFFARTLLQLALCLILMSGPSLGVSNILTRAMVGRYFTTGYAAANGIGQAGHSVALIVVAPLAQFFLDTYGWRGTMLLLGGIFMNLAVCGALLWDSTSSGLGDGTDGGYTVVHATPEPGDRSESSNEPYSCCAQIPDTGCNAKGFGLGIFLEVSFLFVAIIYCCNRVVNDMWVIYFVDHAITKGFSGQDAVTFTAAAGVSNLMSKLFHGPIVDLAWVSLRTIIAALIVFAAACCFLDPWMNSYWLVMVNAVIFMGASGTIGALIDVYTKDLLGPERLVSAFSWMSLLSGFGTCSLGFVPGWIYDASGSYDWAYIVMGSTLAASLAAVIAEMAMYRRGWSRRVGHSL